MSKVTALAQAIDTHVDDGDEVYLGGFTHLIPFAAGHELLRQGLEGLTVIRMTPDLVVDRLIAAGGVDRLVFSYAGNPGVGSLHAFRRAVEDGVPTAIDIEEYTHLSLVARIEAGASGLPLFPVMSLRGSDYPQVTDAIETVQNPYEDGPDEVAVVPPLEPEVAIVHVQRADDAGNAQLWGITGAIVPAVFAAETVILTVEELVDPDVIAADPNRTAIPGDEVDAVVEVPHGAAPSYAQGYYDRDNEAYLAWAATSQTHEETIDWLETNVLDVEDHAAHLRQLGRHPPRSSRGDGPTAPPDRRRDP